MRKSNLNYRMLGFILALQLFCFVQAHANPLPETVAGKVTTSDGRGLAGVSVTIKGLYQGTSTDVTGVGCDRC